MEHFVPSLYLMHRKLADLGVVLTDNEVAYESGISARHARCIEEELMAKLGRVQASIAQFNFTG